MSVRQRHEHDRNARFIARLADGSSPRLARLAGEEGVSPFHAQRSFRRWVGLTPSQFATFARICRARDLLGAARSVLDVALEVGLSGPGRLHDQFISIEGLSPGEHRAGGAGVALGHGCGPTPLGTAAIAWTPRGICRLAFLNRAEEEAAFEARLRREWPLAVAARDDARARAVLRAAFAAPRTAPLRLAVRGTAMQVAVWRALLEIPEGSVTSYAALAAEVGAPAAVRAVAGMVGANPVGYLIPCHRVVRSTGLIAGYRWGIERKMALLARELGRRRAGGGGG